MNFEVYATGSFNKVEGCLLIQRYEVELECGKCGKKKNGLRVDNHRKVSHKISSKKSASYNVTMSCECGTEINLKITEPEDFIVVEDVNGENPLSVHPVKKGRCHLSNLWSDGGVVTGINNVQLTLASTTKERYYNVDISKRVVAEQGEVIPSFIEDFMLEIKQVN
ncbi:Y125 [Enterospora canceri]|uniref:Y125 n=1 Tax=Enterospora canceri TaxID=1081671 RepID=A0A1Y1S5W9_9MICR|nr:Y125 [Enterospora canceri]